MGAGIRFFVPGTRISIGADHEFISGWAVVGAGAWATVIESQRIIDQTCIVLDDPETYLGDHPEGPVWVRTKRVRKLSPLELLARCAE